MDVFVLDSDEHEPDGVSSRSAQARWLEQALAASHAAWKLVVMHHPPFSSGTKHGSSDWMQWPYAAWGADAVLAGHDHTYERIVNDGLPYFVNGVGAGDTSRFGRPLPVSAARFTGDAGAMLIEAGPGDVAFQFVKVGGRVFDEYRLTGKSGR